MCFWYGLQGCPDPLGEAQALVAVKKLDKPARDSEKEFRAEMNAIGRTHHKNLVQLLGFYEEGPHRRLVYEFMSNGSLASYLFGENKPGWDQRVQIAFGVARGLSYLHEECRSQIIHCDIKPQNILLDDYLTARISDFRLAKLLMREQTRTQTDIRGTKGYIAPEWFKKRAITAKVDVHSVVAKSPVTEKTVEDSRMHRKSLENLQNKSPGRLFSGGGPSDA